MEPKSAFVSQYIASLKMLEETINKADDNIWLNKKYKNPFWRIVYHSLFSVDLYLSENEKKYTRWEKHKEGYNFLRDEPLQPGNKSVIGEPYKKEELTEFLEKILNSLKERVDATDLSAPSGFHWLPFDKFELQIYTIRHLQHHTGQLIDRIREEAGMGVGWVRNGD